MQQDTILGKVWWVKSGVGCTDCAFNPGTMDAECREFACHRGPRIAVRPVEPHELPDDHPEHKVATVELKPTNPKEAVGSTKVALDLVPDTLSLFAAAAFYEGATKYGSYNWRIAGVRASTYKAAAERHIKKWWNGEECDPKTKVRHLANAIACLAILLDADVVGKLNDDRPPKADLEGTIAEVEATLKHLRELHAGINPKHCYEKDQSA